MLIHKFFTVLPRHGADMDKNTAEKTLDLKLFSESSGDESAADAGQEQYADESFESLISGRYKEDFGKKMQSVIDRRFRETKELEAFRDGASPLIDYLAEKHGTDKGDLTSLLEKVKAGDENRTDPESSKLRERLTRARGMRSRGAMKIYRNLIAEGEELSRLYPSFDLKKECGTPAFTSLISCGMSVRDAYEACHKDELLGEAMEYTARAVREALSRNISQRTARPVENGLAPVSSAIGKRNVADMSEDEILEIVRKVQRGERVKF